MALKNPRIRYDVVPAKGAKFDRTAEVAGYVFDRDKLIALLKHPWGDDCKIENLRQVDKEGKDLPVQPDELKLPEPAATPAPVAAE